MTTINITEYTLSLLPEDHIDRSLFEIKVAYRSRDRWAVLHGPWCLSNDRDWDYEPSSSSRSDEWLDAHRFNLDTALSLAGEVLPGISVNGHTAASVLAKDIGGRRVGGLVVRGYEYLLVPGTGDREGS